MAKDDIRLPNTSFGPKVASDEIAGVQHVRAKIGHGADGEYQDASAASPIPVGIVVLQRYRREVILFEDPDGATHNPGKELWEATGDYSLAPVDFVVGPSPGEVWPMRSARVMIASGNKMSATTYGDIPELPVGITIAKKNATATLWTWNTVPISSNQSLAAFSTFSEFNNFEGGGTEDYFFGSIQIGDDPASSPILDGDEGEFMAVTVNDDLTGLTQHGFGLSIWVIEA